MTMWTQLCLSKKGEKNRSDGMHLSKRRITWCDAAAMLIDIASHWLPAADQWMDCLTWEVRAKCRKTHTTTWVECRGGIFVCCICNRNSQELSHVPVTTAIVLWCTTRKDDSFLSAWYLQWCVIACLLHGTSLEFSWLGRPVVLHCAFLQLRLSQAPEIAARGWVSHNDTRNALLECWQWNVSLQSLQHV